MAAMISTLQSCESSSQHSSTILPAGADALLHELLSKLTSKDWVYEFLFQSDTLSDTALLTSPHAIQHAIVTKHITTATESANNYMQVLDHHTQSTIITLPAFSTDGITLGVRIADTTTTRPWPCPPPAPNTQTLSRWARFDTNAWEIEVRHCAQQQVQIFATRIPSPKRKTILSITLDNPPKDSNILKQSIQHYISRLFRSELCRSCPACQAPAAAPCRCRHATLSPTHLLDLTPGFVIANLFSGKYSGSANIHLFRKGHVALQACLSCTDHVVIIGGIDTAKEILQKATRHALASQPGIKTIEKPVLEKMDQISYQQTGVGDEVMKLADALAKAEVKEESESSGSGSGSFKLDRKERNRIAAKKSNLKRKLRNKSLRLTLVILRQRVEELRDREIELIREQSWLRQRCRLKLDEMQQSQIPLLANRD